MNDLIEHPNRADESSENRFPTPLAQATCATPPTPPDQPLLSRLPVPLAVVCDLVCGAFSRREVQAKTGTPTPAFLSVLRALVEHAGAKHNRVFPSQKRIAELTGLCVSTVERAVAFFKRIGAIVVLPDFLRRSPDAYPVNGYDLSPLFSLLPRTLQPALAGGSGAFDPAFFSRVIPQNSRSEVAPQGQGSEAVIVVVNDIYRANNNITTSVPQNGRAEDAPQKSATPTRTDAEEAETERAACVLLGFGVAANLAYDLAAEFGTARIGEVAAQARRSKNGVSGGWLVTALRQGWEFPKRGEMYRNNADHAPFSPPKSPENHAENEPKTVPIVAPKAGNDPDVLDALSPDEYNALSTIAEAQIRAANPLFGRVGAPRLPRPAVRDRMRMILQSKQDAANEPGDEETLTKGDDNYAQSRTSFQG